MNPLKVSLVPHQCSDLAPPSHWYHTSVCSSSPSQCKECQDYSALYRKDLRCGDKYKLPNGEKAQCNPKHNRVGPIF